MKKIFTKLLLPATGLVILPIASCSTVSPEEPETTDTLEIVSEIKDLSVSQDETHLSEPIKTKCLGPDKKEKQLDIKLCLKIQGGNELPNWICITEKNEIQITGGKEKGTYTFILYAYNEQEKLYSPSKTFKIDVIDERHIVPQTISLDIEDDQYYRFSEVTTIPMTITPSKEGIEEKYLLKECNFTIEFISGKTQKDMQENDLFVWNQHTLDPKLLISKYTDKQYIDDYKLRITATLVADPSVTAYKDITIHIAETLEQIDEVNQCLLKRNANEPGWRVYSFSNKPTIINLTISYIHHREITAIGVNFCTRSSITNLTQVILPESVKTIEANAFMSQTALCSVEMPGVTFVGENAFKGDTEFELRSGSKMPQFTVVQACAFDGCKYFRLGYQPNIKTIGINAFRNAGFNSFEIGENCTFIGEGAFAGCSAMKSFEIYTVKAPRVSTGIFEGCDGFDSVQVPAAGLESYLDPYYNWHSQGKRIEGIL